MCRECKKPSQKLVFSPVVTYSGSDFLFLELERLIKSSPKEPSLRVRGIRFLKGLLGQFRRC